MGFTISNEGVLIRDTFVFFGRKPKHLRNIFMFQNKKFKFAEIFDTMDFKAKDIAALLQGY